MVWALLLSALLLSTGNAVATPTTATSNDKLRQFMEQVRPQPAASQVGGNAVRAATQVTPEQLQERADLLKKGEAALASLQLEPALLAFERAANILHAADTEIALVRTYMQDGQYRRALASGAHTAGAHLDVVGGSALYAWLLHVGAQTAVAQRLLTQAQTRMPGDPALAQVVQQLRSGQPLATGDMLTLPTRLAPYSQAHSMPAAARVLGSGVLLNLEAKPDDTSAASSLYAMVPLALLPKGGRLWVRNGIGLLSQAKVVQRLPSSGVALLKLATALPLPSEYWAADKEPFPGSPGYAVEFVAPKAATGAAPAWPVLRTGFVGGMVSRTSSARLLGIDMPTGARGGPVFDGAGRLIGIAIRASGGLGGDQLVTTASLQKTHGKPMAPTMPAGTSTASTADKIYENSLKTSLQFIAVP
jgi:hypothetical protein